MKTTYGKLEIAVARMSREDLEILARNVIVSLYGSTFSEEERAMDDDLDALNLNDGDIYLDSEKEWDSGTAMNVSEDCDNADLMIEDIAAVKAEVSA